MSNVVMQTRIRLARNLKKYPFPQRLNTAGKNEVAEEIIKAVKTSALPALSLINSGLARCCSTSEIL